MSSRVSSGTLAGSHADEQMVDAIRRARAGGIRTGLVSNSWGTTRYRRELLAEPFDVVVISGEVGLRKPASLLGVTVR